MAKADTQLLPGPSMSIGEDISDVSIIRPHDGPLLSPRRLGKPDNMIARVQ